MRTTPRVAGDVCRADPTHPLPELVTVYTSDPTTPRHHLTVVCDPTCARAVDDRWVHSTNPLNMPPINPQADRTPPRHEPTCPRSCRLCDRIIGALDYT